MRISKTMQVVMLPTKKASNISLGNSGKGFIYHTHTKPEYTNRIYQYLYIVSNNEIKEGDWVVLGNKSGIQKMNHLDMVDYLSSDSLDTKKIEATTDILIIKQGNENQVTIIVPQIPQSFIEAYVKAEGKITEVDVEMEEIISKSMNKEQFPDIIRIKTRHDNTIIIHQSKTYTRDEVIALMELTWATASVEYNANKESFEVGKDCADFIKHHLD
jgi:hypothetical protein